MLGLPDFAVEITAEDNQIFFHMRILQINKFYHIVGGVDRYFIEVSRLLEKKGHQVAIFSMDDKRNLKSVWQKYFVSNISFEDSDIRHGLKILLRMFYSFEARRKISLLLDNFKPDVAHVHQIYHQISPSILMELKKRKIPVVHTVGDYHLISPHHNNLFHHDHICEASKVHRYYQSFLRRCVKSSYLASLAEGLEQYLHYLSGIYQNNIDIYIAPSKFMEKKLVEYQIPEDKTVTLPYFINYEDYSPDYSGGDYILYFGRLYPEKGLKFLVEAMADLPKIKLKIAGSGPMRSQLKNMIRTGALKNIEMVDKFLSERELRVLIKKCRFTVFPSESYEIFGISILESYALGKPVLASRIGAMPEIIKDCQTGILFDTSHKADFQKKLIKLWQNPRLSQKMGQNGRQLVEDVFNSDKHYLELMEIYKL